MAVTFSVYGTTNFTLGYEENELRGKINSYIVSQKANGYFTYMKLCAYLLKTAMQEDRVPERRKDTYYESPALTAKAYQQVSRLLWELIWAQKVFVDFYKNEYVSLMGNNDTTFGISDGFEG